jgi:predicted nucleic acid-binding protein
MATYDGSAGTLVDTNIWVDCIDARSPWHGWAVDRLQACGERARGVLGHRPCVACKAFASRRSVPEPARGLSPKG